MCPSYGQVVPCQDTIVFWLVGHWISPDEGEVVGIVLIQQWQHVNRADADVGDDDSESDIVGRPRILVKAHQPLVQHHRRVHDADRGVVGIGDNAAGRLTAHQGYIYVGAGDTRRSGDLEGDGDANTGIERPQVLPH